MQRLATWFLVLSLGCGVVGCFGDGLLRTQGRLLKGGDSFSAKVDEGEALQITYVPILPDGKPPSDHYYCDVDQDSGVFMPSGKNGKGMPAGKYRVAIELKKKKKDLFGGKFNDEQSPFIFDVDGSTKEIVIDLDEIPAS
ncbi:MAG: hypothetical protein JWN70_1128 [Planctomycetaceae bacterium]|nr:hypothetical protein [Planctomycetaceae bacterium]